TLPVIIAGTPWLSENSSASSPARVDSAVAGKNVDLSLVLTSEIFPKVGPPTPAMASQTMSSARAHAMPVSLILPTLREKYWESSLDSIAGAAYEGVVAA